VPHGSTFYRYITCLACMGIVNGYPDGTFRPNNVITRGQLAKIVTLAARITIYIPPVQQSFQDVPPGSTFWLYIERAAAYALAQGYRCGQSPNEPCIPPLNRHYYRPNAPATRGQAAVIIDRAAGFTGTPGGQIYEDVLPGSLFFVDTWRLGIRGIMSGYPCGGPGEPCIPPRNMPYFRPYNNVTRGQAAKMVSNTFLPYCQSQGGR
jgi:hypothetical protein